jgi:hypothetical protein
MPAGCATHDRAKPHAEQASQDITHSSSARTEWPLNETGLREERRSHTLQILRQEVAVSTPCQESKNL